MKPQMKKTSLSIAIAAAMCFVFAPGALAQPANSMLYQPNVDLTSLSQNSFSGIVGGIFYSPYYYNVNVNYLGYADPTGAALTDSHTVTIWNQANGSVVASAVVPAGAPTMWANGYAWVQIPTVTLNYQSTYNVGATVVAGQDNWGNILVNTDTSSNPDLYNNGQITWNVSPNGYGPQNYGPSYGPFIQASTSGSSLYSYANMAIYDFNASDAGNPNPTINLSGNDSIYSAVNLGYNLTLAPEPGTLSLAALGTALLIGFRLKHKTQKSVS